MKRKEVVAKVMADVKQLIEVEHVYDLMKAGRVDELDTIREELDLSYISEYCKSGWSGWRLSLKTDEIPDGYCWALAFYTSAIKDEEINSDVFMFESFEEFAIKLAKEAGDIGKSIAVQMWSDNLNKFSTYTFCDSTFAYEYHDRYEM